jgi:GntR family transcriptional regulator/MocR family aminotransferase
VPFNIVPGNQIIMAKRATAFVNLSVLLDRKSALALHRQLYDELRKAILTGRLKPRTRLPSTRDFAAEMDVSRNTVLSAFNQLLAEGYVEGRIGSGTYVSQMLPNEMLEVRGNGPANRPISPAGRPLSRRGEVISQTVVSVALATGIPRPFRSGVPALDTFPIKTWYRLTARYWRNPPQKLMRYGEPAGYRPLREAIAAYLGAVRAVHCVPEQVIMVSGSQQGLDIAARVLLDPGDAAWIEDPGFHGARAALLAAGAKLIPVPVDREGLNVEAGIRCGAKARVAYLTPSHQFPLGATLSLARRLALLKWASKARAWILEDDYDSEFRYVGRPLASLQGLDGEGRVIYIGTFSKVLFPSLRVGYIVAPIELIDAFIKARAIVTHASSLIEQAVLADFINEGHFARHIRTMRTLYAERQAVVLKEGKRELDGLLDLQSDEAGMDLIGWLPYGVDDRSAYRKAAEHGVEVTPLSAYCIERQRRGALRLGYTGYTPSDLRRGVRNLARALRELKG